MFTGQISDKGPLPRTYEGLFELDNNRGPEHTSLPRHSNGRQRTRRRSTPLVRAAEPTATARPHLTPTGTAITIKNKTRP